MWCCALRDLFQLCCRRILYSSQISSEKTHYFFFFRFRFCLFFQDRLNVWTSGLWETRHQLESQLLFNPGIGLYPEQLQHLGLWMSFKPTLALPTRLAKSLAWLDQRFWLTKWLSQIVWSKINPEKHGKNDRFLGGWFWGLFCLHACGPVLLENS